MALTERLLGDEPTMEPTRSAIQVMSGMRLSVAMISSQKKKLYLKSYWTRELMKISDVKRTKETMRPE